ncbi:MAG: Gfo/Idh/MocA family oxidoreductase [Lentisphaerae bacterium]|jgi:UDP-N-acetylglucosamine 3-dehydrogenase|nr:Gfo/Idh/MocA family oxidoreductase [Lentisphaerota bacterium]MBT4822507.1 Gfo/Idh/MocA family oxidoreductase [Lentisphaerota bacterium]MBT5605979.1 Gfo/Idh/MocA family oxidoreductase [Lentisphaerota bacterium]MBT7060549.1 Gfo/Idh/MocA family oxidoreductase [Lentisphaerota bacterium]MBT7848002.1 Gfo/Idh/MocA family oxidoreductase [Lentisphaerota bacterium]
MDKLRVGIIGLGFFGEKHAEVFADMRGVELAAVCTRRDARRQEVADRFCVPANYADFHDLLADPNIDAVSIVTHVNDHRDIAVAALDAGKHVFLEKPMAGTVADCDMILTAAERADGLFMVGHICRFDTRISQAKDAIEKGRIGRIISMHAARNLPAHITGQVLNKISPLMGDGIHDTDIMLWLTGSQIRTVYAQNVRVRDLVYPDIGWAMYRFENDAVGVVETVWCLPEKTPFTIDARLEVIGTEGAIYVDCGNAGLVINDASGVHKPDTAYWPHLHGASVGALRNEISYFVDCIANGCPPTVVTPDAAREAVAVMCAAEKSAASGAVVTL